MTYRKFLNLTCTVPAKSAVESGDVVWGVRILLRNRSERDFLMRPSPPSGGGVRSCTWFRKPNSSSRSIGLNSYPTPRISSGKYCRRSGRRCRFPKCRRSLYSCTWHIYSSESVGSIWPYGDYCLTLTVVNRGRFPAGVLYKELPPWETEPVDEKVDRSAAPLL